MTTVQFILCVGPPLWLCFMPSSLIRVGTWDEWLTQLTRVVMIKKKVDFLQLSYLNLIICIEIRHPMWLWLRIWSSFELRREVGDWLYWNVVHDEKNWISRLCCLNLDTLYRYTNHALFVWFRYIVSIYQSYSICLYIEHVHNAHHKWILLLFIIRKRKHVHVKYICVLFFLSVLLSYCLISLARLVFCIAINSDWDI